jgi:hypothetical protein
VVNDADFLDVRRRDPDLRQLMLLERLCAERTAAVNREIEVIGAIVRVANHVFLEAIADPCAVTWKAADAMVAQSDAAVFQVDTWCAVAQLTTVVREACPSSTNFERPALVSSGRSRPSRSRTF